MLVHAGKYRTDNKNTDNTWTKDNPGKANNTKHSKTKLAWFSHFLWHSARKRSGLILQCSKPTLGMLQSEMCHPSPHWACFNLKCAIWWLMLESKVVYIEYGLHLVDILCTQHCLHRICLVSISQVISGLKWPDYVGWDMQLQERLNRPQFRSFQGRCFYRTGDPTNRVKALNEGG